MINIFKSKNTSRVYVEGVNNSFPEDFVYSRDNDNFSISLKFTAIPEVNKVNYTEFQGKDNKDNIIIFTTPEDLESYLNNIFQQEVILNQQETDPVFQASEAANITDSGSNQVITTQERVDINASVDVHSDSNILPATGITGTEVVIVGGILVQKPKDVIFVVQGWTQTTNDIDTPILVPITTNSNTNLKLDATFNITDAGVWLPQVSFLYASDSTGQDMVVQGTIDNNSLSSNTTTNEILRLEQKDSAGANPDNPAAGTNQVNSYNMKFPPINLGLGPHNIQILYGPSDGGIEANMADLIITLTRIY